MKKVFALLLTALLIAVSMTSQVFAVGETMTAKRGTPVIDGEIDAIWANADRQELKYVKAGDLKSFEPEVEKAFASALWDDDYIYFLFEVTDDDLSNVNPGNPNTAQEWQNDTIFLYIDETMARTESSAYGTPGIYQFSICFDGNTRSPRNGTYSGEIKAATKVTETGFIVEVAFEPEVVDLADGLQIGVDYQYNDGTEHSTRDYCLGWSDETDVASGNASVYGTLILSAESAGGAEQPAAEETPAAQPQPGPEQPAETPVETPVTAPTTSAPVTTTAAPQTGDSLVIAAVLLAAACACGIVFSKKNKIK